MRPFPVFSYLFSAIMLVSLLMTSSVCAQVLIGSGVDQSSSHAWAVYTNSNDEIILVHIPPRDGDSVGTISIGSSDPGELHAVRPLFEFPDAITGLGARVVLVFPQSLNKGDVIRRVFSGRAVPSAVGDVWGFIPTGRMDSEPAIRIAGELVDLVSTSTDVFALLRNESVWTLLKMTDSSWEPIELPAGDSGSGAPSNQQDWRISAAGSDLIAIDLSTAGQFSGFMLESTSQQWGQRSESFEHKNDVGFLPSLHGVYVIDLNDDATRRVRVWSEDGVFTIIESIEFPGSAGLTVLDSVNRLIGISQTVSPDENDQDSGPYTSVKIDEIDLADGSVVYSGAPVVSVPVSANEFRFLVGMMILIMIGVLVVVIMPDNADAIRLPDGFSLADPARRLSATLLDLLLISTVAAYIFDVRVIEIVSLSVIARTDSSWMVIPSVMLSGVVLMSLMEWLFGASPGKLISGMRVVRAQVGPMQRIPLWAAIVRNMIKWVLPPVAALALVDPETLHRGDRATKTIVAAPIEDFQAPRSSNEDEGDSEESDSEG